MARQHQQPQPFRFGNSGDSRHGLNGYKRYACRCAICSAAMSDYAKSRYVPKPAKKLEPQVLVSWWLDRPQIGFTAFVEAQEYQRMKSSRFGMSGLAKPINTDQSN